MQLAAATALTGSSIARYPGGTPADYQDWRTGWHWPNMTWTPHDGPWYKRDPQPATPAGWRRWSQAADIPFTCIDVCQLCNNTEQCCTLELELAGLHEHERVGNDVTHIGEHAQRTHLHLYTALQDSLKYSLLLSVVFPGRAWQ